MGKLPLFVLALIACLVVGVTPAAAASKVFVYSSLPGHRHDSESVAGCGVVELQPHRKRGDLDQADEGGGRVGDGY